MGKGCAPRAATAGGFLSYGNWIRKGMATTDGGGRRRRPTADGGGRRQCKTSEGGREADIYLLATGSWRGSQTREKLRRPTQINYLRGDLHPPDIYRTFTL
jgi:glycine/D-amino acid oxidase-like deaminating enzyme